MTGAGPQGAAAVTSEGGGAVRLVDAMHDETRPLLAALARHLEPRPVSRIIFFLIRKIHFGNLTCHITRDFFLPRATPPCASGCGPFAGACPP